MNLIPLPACGRPPRWVVSPMASPRGHPSGEGSKPGRDPAGPARIRASEGCRLFRHRLGADHPWNSRAEVRGLEMVA